MFSFWCYADFQQRSNERLVVVPQTRSSSNHAVESIYCPDGVKLFKNIQNLGWVVLPQTRPSSFHGVEESFRLDVTQPFQNLSSWWLGRAPQHPLSRPSSIRGVEDSFRFDVVQIFNNIQMNDWSYSPKHGPVPFTVLKNLFVWMLSSYFENIQVDGWAALPNIPCHGRAHFAALNIFFLWCCADFQQRSNERLVVLPQTRSSSFHGVKATFCPNDMKFFENIQLYG